MDGRNKNWSIRKKFYIYQTYRLKIFHTLSLFLIFIFSLTPSNLVVGFLYLRNDSLIFAICFSKEIWVDEER